MTLTFDLLTTNLVRIITHRVVLVFLGLFVIDLWVNTCQTDHVTLRLWPTPWRSWRLWVIRVSVLHRSEDLTHISRFGDLNLSFWPWNWCAMPILPEGSATFLPISVFLELCILGLLANTCQTHLVTSQPWPLTSGYLGLSVLELGRCTPHIDRHTRCSAIKTGPPAIVSYVMHGRPIFFRITGHYNTHLWLWLRLLQIFRKLHDRIAWKLVDFCNVICWTQSLTFCLKISSRCGAT